MRDSLTENQWSVLGALALVLGAGLAAVGSGSVAQSILVAAVGILWLWHPPDHLSHGLGIWALIFLGVGASTFLPAFFFPTPIWREALAQDLGVALTWTHSLQPWLSWEEWTLGVATVAWAGHRWSARQTSEQRVFLLEAFVVGMTAVGILVLWRAAHGLLPTQMAEGFASWGQFANRNQTGTLLMLGGVLSFALGFSFVTKQQGAVGMFWWLTTLVLLLAIIFNGSRASLILFFAGSFFWLIWTQSWSWRNRWLWVGVSLALTGASCLVLWGETLLVRLTDLTPGTRGVPVDFRQAMYADAWHLWRQAPWNGVGLGNFEGVFNTLREASVTTPFRALHPESDWWWQACELGVLGVLLPLILFFLLWSEGRPRRRSGQMSLRKACWVAVGMFVLNSWVDVPAHRWGTLWPAIFIAGLALDHSVPAAAWRLKTRLGRGVGIVLILLVGLRWQSASVHPWMPTRASVAAVELAVRQESDPRRKVEETSRALAWAPLSWELYFMRAVAWLEAGGDEETAAADFHRMRYLEGSSVELIVAEANIWRKRNPSRTLEAWQEAMRRSPHGGEALYEQLLREPDLDDTLRQGLAGLAGQRLTLRTTAVQHAGAEEFPRVFQEFLKDNPRLVGVSDEAILEMFTRWVEAGQEAAFLSGWEQYPEWHRAAWRLYAKIQVRRGALPLALEITWKYLPAPALPKVEASVVPLTNLQQSFQRQPKDVLRGLELYWAQEKVDEAAAHNTLEKIATLEKAPAYVYYLLAQSRQRKGDEAGAWQMIEFYLQRP